MQVELDWCFADYARRISLNPNKLLLVMLQTYLIQGSDNFYVIVVCVTWLRHRWKSRRVKCRLEFGKYGTRGLRHNDVVGSFRMNSPEVDLLRLSELSFI